MMDLPRERQPNPALEGRIVSAFVASGLVRRRRRWRAPLWLAAAAVLIIAIAIPLRRRPSVAPPRKTYALLLYMDSTYRLPQPGHMNERIAEYMRWSDSVDKLGKLDVGGALKNSLPLSGLFIIHAQSDSEANSIAATCPHWKYGGRVDVRRIQ